jgi:hypothetical protein
MIVMTMAMTMTILGGSSDAGDAGVRSSNIRSTKLEAAVLARRLIAALPDHSTASSLDIEIEIEVIPPDDMPSDRLKRNLGAFATRDPLSDTCTLHFVDDATIYRDPLFIAHEVCHCVLDWSDLDGVGYKRRVTVKEATKKEEDAKTCATALAKEELW